MQEEKDGDRDLLYGSEALLSTASFSYDALGRWVSKTINGVTTSYLYDGNDMNLLIVK